MTEPNISMLFEMRTPEQIRDEAIAANRSQVHDVCMDKGPWPLTARQRRLLEILRNKQGRDQAIGIADLQLRLQCEPRQIKSDVRELVVTFRLPIVASRDGDTGGYFFATTADERRTYSADYLKEAAKLIQRALIIRDEHDINVLLGQILLDLKGDPS
jgi:hypothetical protein